MSAPALAHGDDLDALRAALSLSDDAVGRIRRAVQESDQSWVVIAVALGLADDRAIARLLAERHGLPLAPALDAATPPAGLRLPAPSFLRARRIIPIAAAPDGVTAAVADPADSGGVRALASIVGAAIRVQVAPIGDIEAALDRWSATETQGAGLIDLSGFDADEDGVDAGALRDLADRAPVIRLVDQLLGEALAAGASDLHLESMRDHVAVRLRVDGVLRPLRRLPRTTGPALASRLKVLAGMDVANRRSAQDGRATLSIRGRGVDVRLSSVPGLHGETVAVRFLDREAVKLDLDTLGFSPAVRALLAQMIGKPQGLVLVTGPTGHGKTTTLYALLRRLNDGARKILTIEDPVEYELDGVTQVQVNEAAGVTFASSLRAFLRQDPDILLVGEIRDGETARIAAQAALTGHLVLATLHTNDAPSAVTRLRNMGLEPYLVAGVLSGVVAQRLVRRLCHCATPSTDAHERAAVAAHVSEVPLTLAHAHGCADCAQSGYAGRAAIAEAFALTAADTDAIAQGNEAALRQSLAARGFRSLIADGAERAARGETSWPEIMRVTG